MNTNIRRILHCIILACFVMSASRVTAQSGSQQRALWVWGTSMDIIQDTHGYDRDEFFSFVAAPHGNPDHAITRIFMYLDENNLVGHADDVRDFIAQAHSRGLEIELLNGEPDWSLTVNIPNTNEPWNQPALDLVDAVTEYNRNSSIPERFDGIHMDIEPHTLNNSVADLNWDEDSAAIFPQFIATMQEIKARITAHNTATGDSLILGSDIHWSIYDGDFNGNTISDYQEIQDIVDQVGIMNYNVRNDENTLNRVSQEMSYAEQKNYDHSVWIGFETQEVSWRDYDKDEGNKLYQNVTSYWNYGLSLLEERTNDYVDKYAPSSALAGLAFHYYEDIHAGETGYRSLGFPTDENHAPVCSILYPSGNEYLSGSTTIRYTTSDIDGDALGITIAYRNVNDTAWTTMPAIDTENSPMQTNDGTYSFDATSLIEGYYIFKVTVCELKPDGISSYDTSDYPVNIVYQTLETTQPYPNGLEAMVIPQGIRDIPVGWISYFDDESGLSGYWYLLDNQDMSQASFTRADHTYVHCETPGTHTLYIQAVDRCGNRSDIISKDVVFLSDMDNDGTADEYDNDADGDGVGRENDLDDSNPLISRYDILIEAFEFDDSLANSLSTINSTLNIVDPTLFDTIDVTEVKEITLEKYYYDGNYAMGTGCSYVDDNQIYNGNRACRIQIDAAGNVVRLSDSVNTTEDATRALTFEMWIKPEQRLYTENYHVPLAFVGNLDKGIALILQHEAHYMSLRYYINQYKFIGISYPNDAVFDGNWHHIAFSFNGYEGTMKLYLDGELVETRGGLPDTITTTEEMRLFNAASPHDYIYNSEGGWSKYIENSAMFSAYSAGIPTKWTVDNFVNNDGCCCYEGLVDDIRVSKAALPAQSLGYFNRPADPQSDTDSDGVTDFLEAYFQTNPAELDTDNDGLTDYEELFQYITNPNSPDYDNDGCIDKQELRAGTDPWDGNSYLRMVVMDRVYPSIDTGSVFIGWNSVPGKSYSVYVRFDVEGEKYLIGTIKARTEYTFWIDQGTDTILHPGLDASSRFYQVTVVNE